MGQQGSHASNSEHGNSKQTVDQQATSGGDPHHHHSSGTETPTGQQRSRVDKIFRSFGGKNKGKDKSTSPGVHGKNSKRGNNVHADGDPQDNSPGGAATVESPAYEITMSPIQSQLDGHDDGSAASADGSAARIDRMSQNMHKIEGTPRSSLFAEMTSGSQNDCHEERENTKTRGTSANGASIHIVANPPEMVGCLGVAPLSSPDLGLSPIGNGTNPSSSSANSSDGADKSKNPFFADKDDKTKKSGFRLDLKDKTDTNHKNGSRDFVSSGSENAGSALTSPTEDVFADASSLMMDHSPGESPYLSATESGGTELEDSPDNTEKSYDRPPTGSSSQTLTPNDTDDSSSLHKGKSVSLDRLDMEEEVTEKLPRGHRVVETKHYVATSRLLSTSGSESGSRSKHGSSVASPSVDSRNKSLKLTSSMTGTTPRCRDNGRADSSKNSSTVVSKHCISLESGMETTSDYGAVFACSKDLASKPYRDQSHETSSELTWDGSDLGDADSIVDNENYRSLKHSKDGHHTKVKKQRYRYSSESSEIENDAHSVGFRSSLRSLSQLSLEEIISLPKTVPEKLDFRQLEKFEGHMLVSWLCTSFAEPQCHNIYKQLSSRDVRVLAIQFCTNLLVAGVIRKLEGNSTPTEIFRPDMMYYWSHTLALQSSDLVPGKLSPQVWPPVFRGDSTPEDGMKSSSSSLSNGDSIKDKVYEEPKKIENQSLLVGLRREMREELENIKKQHDLNLLTIKGECTSRVAEYERKMKELEQEVEKYKILAGIESLTFGAQWGEMGNGDAPQIAEDSSVKTEIQLVDISTEARPETRDEGVQTTPKTVKALVDQCCSPVFESMNSTKNASTSNRTKEQEVSCEIIPTFSSSVYLSDVFSLKSLLPCNILQPSPANFERMPTLVSKNPPTPCTSDQNSATLPKLTTPTPELSSGCIVPPPVTPLQSSVVPPPPPPPPPPVLGGIQPSNSIPPPPPLPTGIPPPPPPPPPPCGIPPPPPLPGGVPPPPPLPGCIPPPPPPMPGCIPPPPPPMPCGGGSLPPPPPCLQIQEFSTPNLYAARKLPMTPQSAMKPLFWKKIQVNDLRRQHLFDTSPVDCLWENLQEPTVNFNEFEELFSKAQTKKKSSPEKLAKVKRTKEVAKLLDAKRSQALGIFISSLHLNVSDIETALLEFDSSALPLETLNALYDQRPEESELSIVRNHLETKPDLVLDRPEQFIYDLSLIPCFSDRCHCLIFQSTFVESLSLMEQRLINIRDVIQILMTNEGLQTLLGLILAFGNYMNGGTNRGQADGFGLDILAKLKDVKSKDSSMSLLDYLVTKYVRDHDSEVGSDHLQLLPVPEPSDINQAAMVNFDDLQQELGKLQTSLQGCEHRVEKVVKESTEGTVEPFKSNMRKFLDKASIDLKEQEVNLDEARKRYDQCVLFFAVKPKPNELIVNPKDFFGLWLTFCQDFKDAWKKEQQRIIKDRYDQAQKKLKQIQEDKKSSLTTTPKAKTGLKAKLTSKGII